MIIPEKLSNLIHNQLVPPVNQNYINVYNPATGNILAFCPDSSNEDLELALKAAQSAIPIWANTPAEKKFTILNKIADLIDQNRNDLALAESQDQGKPLWLAKNEMIRAAQNFRFFATAALQFASEAHIMENHAVNYTVRQPIGVVACISPWNLPLYLFSWKIAPALAAGNCVIAKPSEITPASAYLLSLLIQESGLPPGVLSILHGTGPGIGQELICHPKIKAISFTGGTATGKHIASVAAPMFKKLSLELGGKNANIIFADAQLDKAVKTTVQSSFLNQGEICLCGSRIYVQNEIYSEFKRLFLEEVAKLTVGDPLNADTRIGAIASESHYHKIMDAIQKAKSDGGHLLYGGQTVQLPPPFDKGWFIQPTIIENLSPTCSAQQEEIFGPVVTLTPFHDEKEVLELANGTSYGLANILWTENIHKANRMALALESGIVWVNCWLLRDLRTPFGGMKQSGIGREGGWEAMRFFTEPKNVCLKINDYES